MSILCPTTSKMGRRGIQVNWIAAQTEFHHLSQTLHYKITERSSNYPFAVCCGWGIPIKANLIKSISSDVFRFHLHSKISCVGENKLFTPYKFGSNTRLLQRTPSRSENFVHSLAAWLNITLWKHIKPFTYPVVLRVAVVHHWPRCDTSYFVRLCLNVKRTTRSSTTSSHRNINHFSRSMKPSLHNSQKPEPPSHKRFRESHQGENSSPAGHLSFLSVWRSLYWHINCESWQGKFAFEPRQHSDF